MTLTRANKRRLLSKKSTHRMGATLTTCFRTEEGDHHLEVCYCPPSPVNTFTALKSIYKQQIITLSSERPVSDRCSERWSDHGDDSEGWSEEEDWGDEGEECDHFMADELWNSFNTCTTNIPYADEFIEAQISISNVKRANEKSNQTYSDQAPFGPSSISLKKVKFCPEPDLVTVIT